MPVRLTLAAAWRYLPLVRRLELGTIRICKRCGRGRAELLTDDGESVSVRLGANRARLLADLGGQPPDDVPWLGDVLARGAAGAGRRVSDVVLDDGPHGLRGLVTWADDEQAAAVAACEPEEALEAALRTGVPIYATEEALRPGSDGERPGHTLH